nr:MAG TPA: hypothetical protein [Caudoviricetes sp.]
MGVRRQGRGTVAANRTADAHKRRRLVSRRTERGQPLNTERQWRTTKR